MRFLWGIIGATVIAFLLPNVTHATLIFYNNAANYSTTANPSGPWLYESVPVASLPSAGTKMVYNGSNWTTTAPSDSFCAISSGAGMHPGNTNDSLLGFVYPFGSAGSVEFSVDSTDGDTSNNSSDGKTLSMWLDDTQLASLTLAGNYSNDIPWSQSVLMNPGDVFYLRLNRRANNSGDQQIEIVNVVLTSVPEPPTVILAALAGVGMLLNRLFNRYQQARRLA